MARRRRNPEIIAGRVNADGSIAAGDGFSVVKGATAGAYTITVAPGMRLVSACANFQGGTFLIAVISAIGGSSFATQIYASTTGAASDAAFTFVAVGVQQ